ncbi:hypothetical protein TW84_15380 [Vibrio neptunius]|nr:hypothetical protein TW84_15380 [Vibrio neptunius]
MCVQNSASVLIIKIALISNAWLTIVMLAGQRQHTSLVKANTDELCYAAGFGSLAENRRKIACLCCLTSAVVLVLKHQKSPLAGLS